LMKMSANVKKWNKVNLVFIVLKQNMNRSNNES